MGKKLTPKKIKNFYKDLLMHAKKVRAYRMDLLEESALAELDRYIERLRMVAKGKVDVPEQAKADQEIETIHEFLVKHGGKIYPRTAMIEFAEMVLIAALVIIGIRSFFLQPFIIPTNSMYPTYNGMLAEVYEAGEAPTLPEKAFRFITRGARNLNLDASTSGNLYIPLGRNQKGELTPFYTSVPGKSWFVFPAVKRRYYFLIDDTLEYIDVPAEFDAHEVYKPFIAKIGNSAKRFSEFPNVPFYKTSISIEEGDQLVNFDILLGDALFVDRFSYHFIKPDVGDPFVFRTEEIDTIEQSQYYIKRLVGTGGDTLEVEAPILYRNGEPIEGSVAFEKNHALEGEYEGYITAPPSVSHVMGPGQQVEIPKDHFFAMGDNSDSSSDSRYWGHVPKESVVGRAVFIYYPFTDHWGPAK